MSDLVGPIKPVARGVVAVVKAVVTVPVAVVGRLDRALHDLSDVATGVGAMHGEFVGMRKDIDELNDGVQALRQEVAGLGGSVGGIRDATVHIDGKIDGVTTSLASVDALTSRLGRLGRGPRENRA